jgi:hypothetical protein
MYSVVHNSVFIALVATNYGHYGHFQITAIQNLKMLVTYGLSFV